MSEIGQAFTILSDEEFSAKYDFKRPSKKGRAKTVVTTSQTGLQATSAANHLVQIGYENVAVFRGSFMEWKGMGNKIITGDMDKDRLVDFNQVKEAVEHNSLLVIDVRNPGERTKPGYISGTENVPCNLSYFFFFSQFFKLIISDNSSFIISSSSCCRVAAVAVVEKCTNNSVGQSQKRHDSFMYFQKQKHFCSPIPTITHLY